MRAEPMLWTGDAPQSLAVFCVEQHEALHTPTVIVNIYLQEVGLL